ncbi:MAG: LytTR family DNA-binding domain-containing protein [Balneolaceae bacterium]
MIRTLIVDDEEHARNRLSYMLKNEASIELIGVSKNGLEAINDIEHSKPDLVFLDIEMPEVNGFDVLSNLDIENLPIVIFVTAFSEYAVKAFEVNALDYIHKPFDKQRLAIAIQRATNKLNNDGGAVFSDKLQKFLQEREETSKLTERFILKSNGSIYLIKTIDILWIEASGNYINFVTEKKKHLMRSTMSGIMEKLNKDVFYQIHRSSIVNLDYVDRIEEWSYGDYKVLMKNGEELKMSRNYKELIKNF